MFEELLAEVENELGPTHARTLGFQRHLIGCLTDLGEYARAEALLDDVVSRVRGTQADKSILMALIQSTRGRLDLSRNSPAAAQRGLRQALDLHVAVTEPSRLRIPTFRRDLGEALVALDRHADAETELRLALGRLPDPAVYPYIERGLRGGVDDRDTPNEGPRRDRIDSPGFLSFSSRGHEHPTAAKRRFCRR